MAAAWVGRFNDRMRAMRTFAAAGFVLLAILAANRCARPASFADTILTRGKILTVDAAFRTVEALAITNGRIVATGTSANIARYAGKNTKVIDVAGATVIPGLIDNRFHFTRGVETWHEQARFEGVDSRREALRILAAKAARLKPGDSIMAQGGWTPRQFASALPAVCRRAGRLHARGARRGGAEESAVRAGGLQRRLREHPRAQSRRAEPGGRRASQRARSRVVSAADGPVRRDAQDIGRAARAEFHGFHARAQFDRPRGRLQPGAIRLPGRAGGEGPAAGPTLADADFNAADPASASKAAELIARTRPTTSTASTASSAWARFSTDRSSISRLARTPGPPRS